MNRLPRLSARVAALASLAALCGGCMDFDAAYTRYCQVPFRCDAGTSDPGDAGTTGPTDGGAGPSSPEGAAVGPAECLAVGSACAEAAACCSGVCGRGACAPVP